MIRLLLIASLLLAHIAEAGSVDDARVALRQLDVSGAAQIVEKMGGEIFVKSKPGEGSIISFTLEFERAPEEGPTNDPSTKVSSEIPGEETIPQAEEEDLTPVFRELVHQLREKEAQALNTVNHIRKRLTSPQFQPDMKQLERLITLYEFDEAIEMLTQLSEELGIEIKDDQTLSD